MRPGWIAAAAVVLLVASVTTAVVREPVAEAPTGPVAVPATDTGAAPDGGTVAPEPDLPSATPPTSPDARDHGEVDLGETSAGTPTALPRSATSTPEASDAPIQAQEALLSGPWTPAPAGLYHYATDGHSGIDGDQRALPSQTTLRISDPGRDGFQARVRDLRDHDGYGQFLAYDLHVREDGIELSRITTATRLRLLAGRTDTRTFAADPPGALVTTDDQVGSTRQFTMHSGTTTIAVTILIDGFETMSIGDVDVDAVVVQQHLTFDGDIEGVSTSRTWLRQGDLLLLREEVDADVVSRGVRHATRYSAELIAPTPA